MILFPIFAYLAVLLLVLAAIASIRSAHSHRIAASPENLEAVAKEYGLAYVANDESLSAVPAELGYVTRMLEARHLKKIFTLVDSPIRSSAKGLIAGHRIEIANIRFSTEIADTWRGFMFGGGYKGAGNPHYDTTRITIDGMTKYSSFNDVAGRWAYGQAFAPAGVLADVLDELRRDGKSTTFDAPSRCVPSKTLGIISSWVCWSEDGPLASGPSQ